VKAPEESMDHVLVMEQHIGIQELRVGVKVAQLAKGVSFTNVKRTVIVPLQNRIVTNKILLEKINQISVLNARNTQNAQNKPRVIIVQQKESAKLAVGHCLGLGGLMVRFKILNILMIVIYPVNM
tara:strand:+ start:67 stop:441 length:375 start_codon:yes stop_codon:yes gene_type:complete